MPTRFLPPMLLLLLCGSLFFFGLGDRDLHSAHEARAAQNAQMVLSDGAWGLPRLFDQHLELQKPPLYYWFVALCAELFGGTVDVWAVRLPAACSALACVLFLYFLGWKRGNALAGFLAALILATCLHFTWLARVGRIDMPLTCAVTIAVGCFYHGQAAAVENRGGRIWFTLGYLAVAIGVLFKGPVAIVLAIGITSAHVLTEKLARATQTSGAGAWLKSLIWGLPLTLLVAGPWFVWANAETGGRLWDVFFWHHNFERGLGGAESLASHSIWFYFPRAFVDLLPWSAALLPAVWLARRIGWANLEREARLGAVWFAMVFVFLSLMSFKRADYLLPAFPGAALFLGSLAARVIGAEEALSIPIRLRRTLSHGIVVVATLTVVGWLAYIVLVVPAQERDWPYQKLGQEIRRHTDMPVIFFRAESHVLAFHVGRPLDTILEWENLDIWASKGFPVYFVMPNDCATSWQEHLRQGRLEEVFRTDDYAWGKSQRPLVVMRSCPPSTADSAFHRINSPDRIK